MTLGIRSGYETRSLGSLTAPGAGPTVDCAGVDMTYQVTVASVGTNVVIRLEGSVDENNWFNLDSANADYTLTANGTYGYNLAGCPIAHTRLRLVGLSGGSPTVSGVVGTF